MMICVDQLLKSYIVILKITNDKHNGLSLKGKTSLASSLLHLKVV